ncbi:MAG: Rhamnulokinase [Lentisphaerae bacterium ADurb.BinA184]|nr:MAG: Rhamnulokinase [Lentisphaerae bacterium ADurb.BinA184]
MKHYLAIDLGASSGRAILGHLEGDRLDFEEVHRFPNGGLDVNGRLVWNLLGLFAEIKTGIRKALERQVALAGIAVDTWGVDFALIDRDGNLVGHPFHYRDAHTARVFDWVFDQVPREEFYAATGIQFMNFNSIFQLATLKRDRSPALEAADKMLPMPNALTYLLCGQVAAEYTHATTTEAYNPLTHDWAWPLIARLGLPRHLFPPVVRPCTLAGPLRPAICEELNCPPIPVILAGSHDTASAVAAVPARPGQPNWAFLSSGTWSLLGVELDQPCLTPAACAAGFTNEGCIDGRIRFLKNIMGLWLVQESRNTWNRQGRNLTFRELDKQAAAAPALKAFVNPNDSRFLAPGDMPARIQAFCRESGQPVPETPGEVVRCAQESLALFYRLTIEEAEALTGRRIETLHLVGGGSQDEQLNRFTANATGRTVVAGPVEATAIGNLLAQAIATGQIAGPEPARAVVRNSFQTTEYRPEDTARWESACRRFRTVVESAR